MNAARQNDGSPDTGALYAWLSRDKDGVEGIVAIPIKEEAILQSGHVVPLVFASSERAMRMKPEAEYASRQRGFPAHLVKFVRQETIATASGIADDATEG